MERLRRKKRQTEKGTREGGNRDSRVDRQTGGGWIQTQKRRDEIILNGRG
jgi:hypothetical protein